MSKIKNGGLDQYGADGPFEQQQFGIAGVEGVNSAQNYTLVERQTLVRIKLRGCLYSLAVETHERVQND